MTTAAHHACTLLADLVTYPGRDYRTTLLAVADELAFVSPRAGQAIDTFAASLEDLSLGQLQELYTSAFDLSPVCPLDLGWHLFGEQYERGAFLVRMRDALDANGIPESTELPDHLSYVLQLAACVPLSAMPLMPEQLDAALAKMTAALEVSGSPFRHLMSAIQESLHA